MNEHERHEAQHAVHEAERRALRAEQDDYGDERKAEQLRIRANALRALYDAVVASEAARFEVCRTCWGGYPVHIEGGVATVATAYHGDGPRLRPEFFYRCHDCRACPSCGPSRDPRASAGVVAIAHRSRAAGAAGTQKWACTCAADSAAAADVWHDRPEECVVALRAALGQARWPEAVDNLMRAGGFRDRGIAGELVRLAHEDLVAATEELPEPCEPPAEEPKP